MSEGVVSAIENATKKLQDVQAQLDELPSLELIALSARHEAIGEAMGDEGFDICIDEQADKVVYFINGHDDFRIMREKTKHSPFQLMKREEGDLFAQTFSCVSATEMAKKFKETVGEK